MFNNDIITFSETSDYISIHQVVIVAEANANVILEKYIKELF